MYIEKVIHHEPNFLYLKFIPTYSYICMICASFTPILSTPENGHSQNLKLTCCKMTWKADSSNGGWRWQRWCLWSEYLTNCTPRGRADDHCGSHFKIWFVKLDVGYRSWILMKLLSVWGKYLWSHENNSFSFGIDHPFHHHCTALHWCKSEDSFGCVLAVRFLKWYVSNSVCKQSYILERYV